MPWCFALVNNRLAEVYFKNDRKGNLCFVGHCYVDDVRNWTQKEQKWIAKDTATYQFSYRNGQYHDKQWDITIKGCDPKTKQKSISNR